MSQKTVPIMASNRGPLGFMLRGFTLIELLVVISIIAVLVGITLPILGKARDAGKRVVELSSARQLMVGYTAYSNDYEGRFIPGFLDDVSGLGNRYALPDGTIVAGEPLKRWPWRLLYYIDFQLGGSVMFNDQEPYASPGYTTGTGFLAFWQYEVSLYPSFGMNMFWVGGDERHWTDDTEPIGHVSSFEKALAPSIQIAFTSAWTNVGVGSEPLHGYFWVRPPSIPGSTPGWSPESFTYENNSLFWGHVDGRHDGAAVTLMLDGHAETTKVDELRDMRRWSQVAYQENDPNYTLP